MCSGSLFALSRTRAESRCFPKLPPDSPAQYPWRSRFQPPRELAGHLHPPHWWELVPTSPLWQKAHVRWHWLDAPWRNVAHSVSMSSLARRRDFDSDNDARARFLSPDFCTLLDTTSGGCELWCSQSQKLLILSMVQPKNLLSDPRRHNCRIFQSQSWTTSLSLTFYRICLPSHAERTSQQHLAFLVTKQTE